PAFMPRSAPAATGLSAKPTPRSPKPTWPRPDQAIHTRISIRSTRGLEGAIGGRRERDGFAAPAGGSLVRVVENELGRELVDLVVHLGTEQKQHGLRVDENPHAFVLDHLVGGIDLLGVFHRVGHTGAAAVLDA